MGATNVSLRGWRNYASQRNVGGTYLRRPPGFFTPRYTHSMKHLRPFWLRTCTYISEHEEQMLPQHILSKNNVLFIRFHSLLHRCPAIVSLEWEIIGTTVRCPVRKIVTNVHLTFVDNLSYRLVRKITTANSIRNSHEKFIHISLYCSTVSYEERNKKAQKQKRISSLDILCNFSWRASVQCRR